MHSKGQALLKLAQIKNISLDNVIAFGNGENDIDMLKIAGTGIAMDNSFDTVKEVADAICEDNEHDGIGKYLEGENKMLDQENICLSVEKTQREYKSVAL